MIGDRYSFILDYPLVRGNSWVMNYVKGLLAQDKYVTSFFSEDNFYTLLCENTHNEYTYIHLDGNSLYTYTTLDGVIQEINYISENDCVFLHFNSLEKFKKLPFYEKVGDFDEYYYYDKGHLWLHEYRSDNMIYNSKTKEFAPGFEFFNSVFNCVDYIVDDKVVRVSNKGYYDSGMRVTKYFEGDYRDNMFLLNNEKVVLPDFVEISLDEYEKKYGESIKKMKQKQKSML